MNIGFKTLLKTGFFVGVGFSVGSDIAEGLSFVLQAVVRWVII